MIATKRLILTASLLALVTATTALPANAAPFIFSVSPPSVTAGGSAFDLYVSGIGFLAGTQLAWNGAYLPTTVDSANQLHAGISASLIRDPAGAVIWLQNPDGALSNTWLYFILAPRSAFCTAGVASVPLVDPFSSSVAVGDLTLGCSGLQSTVVGDLVFTYNLTVTAFGLLTGGSTAYAGVQVGPNAIRYSDVTLGPTLTVEGVFVNSLFGGGTLPSLIMGNVSVLSNTPLPVDNATQVVAIRDRGSAPPVIPEPASLLLLGTGLAGLAAWRRRRT